MFSWFSKFITNPFSVFKSNKKESKEEEDDDDDDKSTMKKMPKYKKIKQHDDDSDDESVVIIEADKLKKQMKRELKKEKLLAKKRQEAICGDVSNYDQFEVGVLLLGMEKGNKDKDLLEGDDESSNKGKVLPVSTLRSPYFDGEANLDDVMFARHVSVCGP